MWMLVVTDERSTDEPDISQHPSRLAAEACMVDLIVQRLNDDDDGEWDGGVSDRSIRFTDNNGDLLFSRVCKILEDPVMFSDYTGISFAIMPMPPLMHDMAEELARTDNNLMRNVWRWWVTKQAKEALGV